MSPPSQPSIDGRGPGPVLAEVVRVAETAELIGLLIGLSRLAQDQVVGPASEWPDLWVEAGSLHLPSEVVAEIRGLLGVALP